MSFLDKFFAGKRDYSWLFIAVMCGSMLVLVEMLYLVLLRVT
jgi:hypothetical protein